MTFIIIYWKWNRCHTCQLRKFLGMLMRLVLNLESLLNMFNKTLILLLMIDICPWFLGACTPSMRVGKPGWSVRIFSSTNLLSHPTRSLKPSMWPLRIMLLIWWRTMWKDMWGQMGAPWLIVLSEGAGRSRAVRGRKISAVTSMWRAGAMLWRRCWGWSWTTECWIEGIGRTSSPRTTDTLAFTQN